MPSHEESQNLAVIAEYFTEFWAKGNPNVVDTLCADDFVMNYPMHGARVGKQAVKDMLVELKEVCISPRQPPSPHCISDQLQAFPDLTFRPYQHPLIASGPYVIGRWIGGGTHTGTAFSDLAVGALDEANTGKKMFFSGITIFTLKDGKIVDETGEEGALTALQQLGLVDGPNAGKEARQLYD